VVLCVHGLSRQGRDFDVLAQALCARAGAGVRVVCPDVAGQQALPFKIRKLVLNDVGPVLEWQALQRIGNYLGEPVRFTSVEQAADAMRLISATFGPHTREQWLALSRPMLRQLADGSYTFHYDPAITVPYRTLTPETSAQGETTLWALYDAITAETLLLRGADSDLLSPATAQAMTQRGPRARLVEFAGVGHAPTLVAPEQVRVVVDFLLGPAPSP
jgi:pimeloyl-ACP methyl ester carboxylesterase